MQENEAIFNVSPAQKKNWHAKSMKPQLEF